MSGAGAKSRIPRAGWRPAYPAILAAIAVLEVAWLGWVLGEPLPNANPPGERSLNRSYLLLRFFPEVVPGLKFKESFLGTAVRGLKHVENLPQRVPIVLAAGFILGAALSSGGLALRALGLSRIWSWPERLMVAFGIGMSGLGLMALISARIGMLNPWTARIGLLIPITVHALLLIRERLFPKPMEGFEILPTEKKEPVSRLSIGWLLLVVSPFLVIMALGSMLPTIDYDALEYHLQGPKEYFLAGRIGFLPHNVYTSMPFGVEMLHLLGMYVMNDWWWGALVGQLLVASFAPMAGLAIWVTARRWGSPRAAWVAAMVYLTTPWIYRLAALPYVEGPLCYYHAALVWTAGVAWSASAAIRGRAWLVVGLLAGGAMAIKYPALISAVVPFGAVAAAASWRARSAKPLVAFGVGVAIVIGPWLIKNVVDTGNPVYPLGYRVFGGRDWDEVREKKWGDAHGRKPIEVKALLSSMVDVAGRSDWQSPALIALAPLALLRPGSRRVTLLIGGYVTYLFLTWWLLTHRLDRFWLPLLPGLAVLAGLGADWTRGWAWTLLLGFLLVVTTVANFADCTAAITAPNEWTAELGERRKAVPRELNASLFRLDAELPRGSRPLLVGEAAVFHFTRPFVYNTVFDRETFETIDRDRSPEEVRSELARRGITHIYVDWFDIDRYRSPGNYGFTDYVTPDRFERLVRAGVLSEPRSYGVKRELYTVLPAN
jgi:hypothetical protein